MTVTAVFSRGTRILFALGSIALAETAAAQPESNEGWYVGGGFSLTDVFAVDGEGWSETSERGSSDVGIVINGGYRWSRNLAFEAGYLDGGAPTFNTIAIETCQTAIPCRVEAKQDTTAFNFGVVGIWPIRSKWEIFMKGGITFWSASSMIRTAPLLGGASLIRSVDDDGESFALSIGGGVMLQERAHLRLEYLAFRTDDDLLGLDPNREARYDQLALEIHWRF